MPVCFVSNKTGNWKKAELKSRQSKQNEIAPLVWCKTDEQTLWDKPSTPLVLNHIQTPNSSSLVSHDDFNEHLAGKVWLGHCPLGPLASQAWEPLLIAGADEATFIIEHRREEMWRGDRNEETKRDGKEGGGHGTVSGVEGLPENEEQWRADD